MDTSTDQMESLATPLNTSLPPSSLQPLQNVISDDSVNGGDSSGCRVKLVPCCRDTWHGCCCDCYSDRFVEMLLLFEDRQLELQFLTELQRPCLAKAAMGVVWLCVVLAFLIVVGAFAITFQLVAASVSFVVFALPTALYYSFLRKRPYQIATAATWTVLLTVFGLAIRRSLEEDGRVIMPTFIYSIAVPWVCQKILVISGQLPARMFFPIVPVNVVLLIVSEFVSSTFSTTGSTCQIVTAVKLAPPIVGASYALLWVVVRKESAVREIFYWNHATSLNVDELKHEADPFDTQKLREWMTQTETEAVVGEDDSQAAFWAIPSNDLHLDHKVAAGGSGVVWKAQLKDKLVAAKQLYTPATGFDAALQTLSAEVAVLAQLHHENIVRFLGLCRGDDSGPRSNDAFTSLFVVQELCASDLRGLLVDTLPIMDLSAWSNTVLRIAREMAAGMAYLHSREIAHRDLKPENVFLTQDGTVRIGDFGVSRQFLSASTSSSPSNLQSGRGTPAYMAPEGLGLEVLLYPERHEDMDSLENSGDVYAFGIIVWEILCSRHSDEAIDSTDTHESPLDSLRATTKSNLLLGTQALTGSNDLDLQTAQLRWSVPSSSFMSEHSPQSLQQLHVSCCSFFAINRPHFDDILSLLERAIDIMNLKHGSSVQKPSSSSSLFARIGTPEFEVPISQSATKSTSSSSPLHQQEYVSTGSTTVRPPVQPAFLSRETANNVDISHVRCTSNVCRCRCWVARGLRFADTDAESRFLAFSHANDFFRVLKWPYSVLAALYLLTGIATAGMNCDYFNTSADVGNETEWQSTTTASTMSMLVHALQWTIAALVAWFPSFRKRSFATLVAASTVVVVVNNGFAVYNAVYRITLLTQNITEEEIGMGRNGYMCLQYLGNASFGMCVPKAVGYLAWYNDPIIDALTTPVTLMMLGLPMYQYIIPFLFSFGAFCSLVGIVGYVVGINSIEGSLNAQDYGSVVAIAICGLAIYPSSFASVVAHEQSRRALFVQNSRLCEQQTALHSRAVFHGYREALAANRHYFEATQQNEDETPSLSNIWTANRAVSMVTI